MNDKNDVGSGFFIVHIVVSFSSLRRFKFLTHFSHPRRGGIKIYLCSFLILEGGAFSGAPNAFVGVKSRQVDF